MQVPAWADVKAEWRSENLGWFDERTGELVGVGLVLYRQLPKIKRYLAYLPRARSSTGSRRTSTTGSSRCWRT